MNLSVAVFALAAAVDGQTVLRHASALTALGPHPFGSPRTRAAAEYIASQFRDVGLSEVQVQEFQGSGKQGANVIGVLRAPGREFLVIATHHDTAPDSPGAHDAGGGPGLLIELGRVFARDASRPRTLVFASFDGGASGFDRGVGATAYLATLGSQEKDLVAAVALGGFGGKGGAPVVHTYGHAGKGRASSSLSCPAWLGRAALDGAARTEVPLAIGDPGLFSWLYQPAVRTFRIARAGGEDAAFSFAGVPTLFLDDSPASAPFPWRDQPADTVDKLDIEALAGAGQATLGALRAIVQAPRGPAAEPAWFAAFGRVFGAGALTLIGILSLGPGLVRAYRSRGPGLVARVTQAVLFAVLLWRHPLPALAVLVLPNLASATGSMALSLLALSGAAALAATGIVGWRRGLVTGTWLEAWEIALFGLALAASLVTSRFVPAKSRAPGPSARGKGLPKSVRRRPRAR
jgi:Peptidase family M28